MLSWKNYPAPHSLSRHAPYRRPSCVVGARRSSSNDYNTLSGGGSIVSTPNAPSATKTSHPQKIQVSASDLLRPIKEIEKSARDTTHNAEALESFSLFLPLYLPSVIIDEALVEYILLTTSFHLRSWSYDKKMGEVDVSLPTGYSKSLQSRKSTEDYLKIIFNSLSSVKSIETLHLPFVSVTDVTCSALIDMLQPFSQFHCSVTKIDLPVFFEISTEALELLQLSEVIKTLTMVVEITFASSTTLHDFAQKISAGSTKITFKIINDFGPDYPLDSSKEVEKIDLKAIESLSISTDRVGGGEGDEGGIGSQCASDDDGYTLDKEVLTSDNTYLTHAQLCSDGISHATFHVWGLKNWHEQGLDGSGTTIALLDSGINRLHFAFRNKTIEMQNFITDPVDVTGSAVDFDGHGSKCAGIAAGSSFFPENNNYEIPSGVAPGAKLIMCKVTKTTTKGCTVIKAAVVKALEWLKDEHISGNKIDVVSLSFGGSFTHEEAKAISDLVSNGVIVVCAASNKGSRKRDSIDYPARLGHVLCIGSQNYYGKPSYFTPTGRELDFLAPGEYIWGPGPGSKGPYGRTCHDGTSCSSPAVAGLVCLVLQHIRQECGDTEIHGKPIMEYVKNVWVMRGLLKEMSTCPGTHTEAKGHGILEPERFLNYRKSDIVRIVEKIAAFDN